LYGGELPEPPEKANDEIVILLEGKPISVKMWLVLPFFPKSVFPEKLTKQL
jgi:hypothetical protein